MNNATNGTGTTDGNWAAAGMVDLFDDMQRRRARRRLWLVTLVLIGTLSVPILVLIDRLQDAQRQVLLDEYDVQRPRLDLLPSGNPAVDKAREESQKLRRDAEQKSARVGIQDLQRALDLIYESEQLSRDEKRLRKLLDPIGEAIEGTPWHETSDVIRGKKTACLERRTAIVGLLDRGEVAEAEVRLAVLLVALGEVQRENVQALQTDASRTDWLRLAGQLPERLRDHPTFVAIRSRVEQGDVGWQQGDWINARLCYMGAAADLQSFLERELTANEKSRVQQADAERITRLEKENADLVAKLSGVETQLTTLEKQIVQATVERSAALEQVNNLTADLAAMQPLADAGRQLPEVQAALKKSTNELDMANQAIEKLTASEKSLLETKAALEMELADSRVQVQELEKGILNRRQARPAPGPAPSGAGSGIVSTTMAAGMPMVRIPAGKFMMGSDEYSGGALSVHEVEITKSFYIGVHEVTIGQVLLWLNSPGVVVKANWMDFRDADCPITQKDARYELNTATKFGRSERQPMVCISQIGATAFCDWCSQQDPQHTYRLPWEAEWEYAARAGSSTEFPWGDSCKGTEANINGEIFHGGPYLQVTCDVGSYLPNDWGLYDTVGNVAEWCGDRYDHFYYERSPKQDPQGPASGVSVVWRSGSWEHSEASVKSSTRFYEKPGNMSDGIGFRVVAE